ncbi:MAG: PH domain-containing protein [Nocardioidaceae bacterium]
MTRPLEHDFQRVHPISPFLRVGVFILAGILATWRQIVEDFEAWVLLLTLAGFLIVGLVYGLLSWWFTRFRIDSEELRIDSGVLMRRSRRISIERLQGVDVVQPFLARLFGMAELRFEVAGGSSTEAPLAYLRLGEAHRLRSVLLDRDTAAPARPAGSTTPTTDTPADAQPVDVHAPRPAVTPGAVVPGAAPPGPATPRYEREIARVDPGWLVVGTLLSTEFIASLVFAFLAVVGSVLFGGIAGLALVLPAVLGVGSVLVRGIVQQWGFVLSDIGRGWRLRSGLFDLRSQTVPLDRVQGIVLAEPLLWRPLGWVKVQVDVAGYAGTNAPNGGPSTSTLLPVAPRPLALAVLARLVPGTHPTDVAQRPAPRRARWFRPVGWRYLGVGFADDVVVTTRGWVKRRTDIVPHHKTQSIRVRQGLLQRRLSVVDVTFQTTPGPVDAVAKHRPVEEIPEWVSDQLERAANARRLHPSVSPWGTRDPA